jgi:hypothetical protein
METLSHILASFDIFQIFINAFPHIVNPIASAFTEIFGSLFGVAKRLVETYPGMVGGTLIFPGVYLIFTSLVNRKKARPAMIRK